MVISQKNKKLLCEFVKYTCESCHRKFDITNLEIHNLFRDHDYTDFRKLKVLCKYPGKIDNKESCHNRYHQNEHNHIKSR